MPDRTHPHPLWKTVSEQFKMPMKIAHTVSNNWGDIQRFRQLNQHNHNNQVPSNNPDVQPLQQTLPHLKPHPNCAQ